MKSVPNISKEINHLGGTESWMAQANYIFGRLGITLNHGKYFLVTSVRYELTSSQEESPGGVMPQTIPWPLESVTGFKMRATSMDCHSPRSRFSTLNRFPRLEMFSMLPLHAGHPQDSISLLFKDLWAGCVGNLRIVSRRQTLHMDTRTSPWNSRVPLRKYIGWGHGIKDVGANHPDAEGEPDDDKIDYSWTIGCKPCIFILGLIQVREAAPGAAPGPLTFFHDPSSPATPSSPNGNGTSAGGEPRRSSRIKHPSKLKVPVNDFVSHMRKLRQSNGCKPKRAGKQKAAADGDGAEPATDDKAPGAFV
ncbi:hypothetical protein B0H13DRAFT_1872746 [Mycena leptocephala]|nr:hypothetical protein B0H13DRAFT_1872746 [Mycena leptocephala]